jgi:hypothetical protein
MTLIYLQLQMPIVSIFAHRRQIYFYLSNLHHIVRLRLSVRSQVQRLLSRWAAVSGGGRELAEQGNGSDGLGASGPGEKHLNFGYFFQNVFFIKLRQTPGHLVFCYRGGTVLTFPSSRWWHEMSFVVSYSPLTMPESPLALLQHPVHVDWWLQHPAV